MRNSKGQFIKGTSGFTGKHSEETKAKISETSRGRRPTKKQLEALKLGQQKTWTPKMKKNVGRHGKHSKGENHYLWKDDDIAYNTIHQWVRRHSATPRKCEFCGVEPGKSPKGKNLLDFANKSGHYKREIDDWIILCKPCHGEYDKKRRNQTWLKKLED